MKNHGNSEKNKPKSEKPQNIGDQERQPAKEERNPIIVDYRVGQPVAPSGPEIHSSHDWANLQEGLRFQIEAERKRAMAEAYKYLTPPK